MLALAGDALVAVCPYSSASGCSCDDADYAAEYYEFVVIAVAAPR